MKRYIRFIILFILLTFLLPVTVCAGVRKGYGAIYGVYEKDNLSIISLSEKWTNKKLEGIYLELINNVHGAELAYLSHIYLYPDSPEGVEGNYYEDIEFDGEGFHFGKNAYIEIFNMDTYSKPEDIAYVLAHEYGHHYTIFNISVYENKYYTDWKDSEYAYIRSLNKYPVDYGRYYFTDKYMREWDIAEIAVNDYMQLLSSPNARTSGSYMDTADLLAGNVADYTVTGHFNSRPQENLYLPLGTDVDGLYEYLLKAGGISMCKGMDIPYIDKSPEIKSIRTEDSFLNPKYTLEFEPAVGEGPFEYTVVMYPSDMPFHPSPIKTISDGEELKAVFGTVVRLEADGSLTGIFEYYAGEYMFRVFAMDANGYYYSSKPHKYDFGDDFFDMAKYLGEQ